jgi:hypothetical protein
MEIQKMQKRKMLTVLACVCCALIVVQTAAAQAPLLSHVEPVAQQTGSLDNPTAEAAVVYEEVVDMGPATAWLWIVFEDVNLAPGSYIRITSLEDGQVQTLDAEQMRMWSNRSAGFNGQSVSVELVAAPGTTGNSFTVKQAVVSDPVPEGAPREICGTDDRVTSTEPAVGRLLVTIGASVGICTAWIADVPAGGVDKCHASAGHCIDDSVTSAVLQFNVPASDPDCFINMPLVADQFAVLIPTVQSSATTTADWSVFECSTSAGQTTFQHQGAALSLALASSSGQAVKGAGYGSDGDLGGCVCSDPNGAASNTLQESPGTLATGDATHIEFDTDVCGGDSGSPVIRISDGLVVGNITHNFTPPCPDSTLNWGTRITEASWTAAWAACAAPQIPDDIPAVSNAGRVGLILLVLTAGIIVIRRGRALKAA